MEEEVCKTDGEGKKGRLVRQRSEEIKLRREKMGCTHTYGMI